MKDQGINILHDALSQLPQLLISIIGYYSNICDFASFFIEFPTLIEEITAYIEFLDNSIDVMKILTLWYASIRKELTLN